MDVRKGDPPGKLGYLASLLSKREAMSDTNRSAIYDFLFVGLSRTVCEINGDFGRKWHFPTPCI